MGFDPATMALAGGIAQGAAGFMGGQNQAEAARRNAAINRQYAAMARQKTINDILMIRAEERRQKVKQGLANDYILGRFLSKIGGVSGVAMTGSTMDAMAGQVEMAWNKMQMITAQSLAQQTGAQNLGDREVYKYTIGAQQYDYSAETAEQGAWLKLATGGIGGITGALS